MSKCEADPCALHGTCHCDCPCMPDGPDNCLDCAEPLWEAFIGERGHRTVLRRIGTWEQARDALVAWLTEELAGYRPEACAHCRTAAEDSLTRLQATAPGKPFAGDVDWDDLVLSVLDPL